ncbi:MAG: BrnT family toxin, partial [Chloroflexota bacterium]
RQVLANQPLFRLVEKGHRPGEDVYAALGRTNAGRYLTVFFVYKKDQRALVISAREMTRPERKAYERR